MDRKLVRHPLNAHSGCQIRQRADEFGRHPPDFRNQHARYGILPASHELGADRSPLVFPLHRKSQWKPTECEPTPSARLAWITRRVVGRASGVPDRPRAATRSAGPTDASWPVAPNLTVLRSDRLDRIVPKLPNVDGRLCRYFRLERDLRPYQRREDRSERSSRLQVSLANPTRNWNTVATRGRHDLFGFKVERVSSQVHSGKRHDRFGSTDGGVS